MHKGDLVVRKAPHPNLVVGRVYKVVDARPFFGVKLAGVKGWWFHPNNFQKVD